MVMWWILSNDIDVSKSNLMMVIIMQRSVNLTVDNQIRLLSKDQINTW